MTEVEWQRCRRPEAMVSHITTAGTERKVRLFLSECCQRAAIAVDSERLRALLTDLDRCIEGAKGPDDLAVLRRGAWQAALDIDQPLRNRNGILQWNGECSAAAAVVCATNPYLQSGFSDSGIQSAASHARDAVRRSVRGRHDRASAETTEARYQLALLRDIFGNPFRSVTFPPEWRTSTAVAMARQLYDSRGFAVMTILADALQDAGCDSDDILSHCRGTGPHVRGCWVVDLVLEKT